MLLLTGYQDIYQYIVPRGSVWLAQADAPCGLALVVAAVGMHIVSKAPHQHSTRIARECWVCDRQFPDQAWVSCSCVGTPGDAEFDG